MSNDERQLGDAGELFPVTIGYMQIRMADTAGFHLDQDFAFVGLGTFDFLNHEWLFQFVQDCCFHGFLLMSCGLERTFSTLRTRPRGSGADSANVSFTTFLI